MITLLIILELCLIALLARWCIRAIRNRQKKYHYYAEVFQHAVLVGRIHGFVSFSRKALSADISRQMLNEWKSDMPDQKKHLEKDAVLMIKSLTRL